MQPYDRLLFLAHLSGDVLRVHGMPQKIFGLSDTRCQIDFPRFARERAAAKL